MYVNVDSNMFYESSFFQEALHDHIFILKQEKEELLMKLKDLQNTVEGVV